MGYSFGASITLTLLTTRPDLLASVTVHEPPLFAVLDGTHDRAVADALAVMERELREVTSLLEAGDHARAARLFVEEVAFGPRSWGQLPDALRQTFLANAPTFLDERHDPSWMSIDDVALAATTVPTLLTSGTESPVWFPAVIAELAALLPHARVEVLTGAGHVPHVSHPDRWLATLLSFQDDLRRPPVAVGPGADAQRARVS